jgi:hypothetical protein
MKNKIFGIFVFIFCGLFFGGTVHAVSQVANPIIIDNALQGEDYEKVLMIVHPENERTKLKLVAEGEIADWVTFYSPNDKNTPIKDIALPEQSDANVIARFSIPKDADKKDYSGSVSISTIPLESDADNTKVFLSLKVPRSVNIKVGGEAIKNCNCHIIPSQGFKAIKNRPIKFDVFCTNTGNVRIAPTIKLKIEQSEASVAFAYPENKELMRPYSSAEWSFEWQPITAQDKFRVLAQIMIGEDVIQEEGFGFEMTDGADFGQASLHAIFNNNSNLFMYAGIIVLVVVMVTTFIFFNRRRKTKNLI